MTFLYPDFMCTDGIRPAPNAAGSFYAEDDVAFMTPLQVYNVADVLQGTTAKADGYGYVRGIRLDVLSAVWKSGPLPEQGMQSFEGLRLELEAARLAAESSATDAGNSAASAAASAGLVGAPAGEAVRVAIAPGGAAHTELNSTYVGDGSAVEVADKASGYNADLIDAATNGAIMLHLDHAGAGSAAAYALDIRNRPGAKSAFVIHQYSADGPAWWLDNTDSGAGIRIHNTQNETLNPGRDGTGDFIELMDHGAKILYLNKDLTFVTNQGTKNVTFLNTVGKALSVQQASSYTGSAPGLEVQKLGTGAGAGVDITNAGSGRGVHVRQNGANNGIQIDMGVGAAGFYPMLLNGQNYGPKYVTATDGGVTLTIEKNGTGAGDAARVTNKGTGNALSVWDAAGQLTRLDKRGALVFKASTAPLTSELVDGETILWRDATTGDLKATSRVAGVLKTGTVTVA